MSARRDADLAGVVAVVAGVLAGGLPARAVEVRWDASGRLVAVSLPVYFGVEAHDAVVAAGLVAWAGVLAQPVFAVCRTGSGFMVDVKGSIGGTPWRVTGHLHRAPVRGVPLKRFTEIALAAAVVAELAAGAVAGEGAAA